MPTTTEAARILSCSPETVLRACKRHQIGQRETCGWILTADDIERLRPLIRSGPGNPRIAEESARGVAARKRKKKS